MTTTILIQSVYDIKTIEISGLTWVPNVGEEITINDSLHTIKGKVIDIKHEIYTASGTHYIMIKVK